MNVNRWRSVLFVVVAAGISAPAPAASQARIPPSTLEYPLVWEFKTPPARAVAAAGSSCEVAQQYVTLVAAKRAKEIPDLFAEDGVFLFQGRLRKGRAEIHGFYDTVNVRGVIPISFTDKGAECFMETANLVGNDDIWRLTAVDHFTIAPDRKIARLIIWTYTRSAAAVAPAPSPPR
jgi:hypothetical protein